MIMCRNCGSMFTQKLYLILHVYQVHRGRRRRSRRNQNKGIHHKQDPKLADQIKKFEDKDSGIEDMEFMNIYD